MIEKYQVLIGSVLISLSILFSAFCINNSIQELADGTHRIGHNVSNLANYFYTEKWSDFLDALSNNTK